MIDINHMNKNSFLKIDIKLVSKENNLYDIIHMYLFFLLIYV